MLEQKVLEFGVPKWRRRSDGPNCFDGTATPKQMPMQEVHSSDSLVIVRWMAEFRSWLILEATLFLNYVFVVGNSLSPE